ncbi:hypothetical protein PIB30_022593 [Stylosanthes scabra]|uniref:G domain-containing protein n=1 Tax=Stylosanthes scabra TaxID=79078 RepID=A0ABU6Q8V9_9FABA|nr:hypothetical protein [Stylosanthes scabra]
MFVPALILQVGLPNVGKYTLFNMLTKIAIPAENFPFCTVEPNEARDIEFMERKIEDLEKRMKRGNDKQLKIELECCQMVKAFLEEGKDVRLGDWKAADIEIINTFQLLNAKSVVYLV